MKPIRVLLVDDHIIFLESLSVLLGSIEGITVAAMASNGQDALAILEQEPVDIVLADLHMPVINGIELTRRIQQHYPQTRVLMLSMTEDTSLIQTALKAGIKGYLPKNTNRRELERAIRSVVAGQTYFSQVLESSDFPSDNPPSSGPQKPDENIELTPRELQILRLIVKGIKNQTIANLLFISLFTVETHRRNLFRKAGVSNPIELYHYALKKGLIDEH